MLLPKKNGISNGCLSVVVIRGGGNSQLLWLVALFAKNWKCFLRSKCGSSQFLHVSLDSTVRRHPGTAASSIFRVNKAKLSSVDWPDWEILIVLLFVQWSSVMFQRISPHSSFSYFWPASIVSSFVRPAENKQPRCKIYLLNAYTYCYYLISYHHKRTLTRRWDRVNWIGQSQEDRKFGSSSFCVLRYDCTQSSRGFENCCSAECFCRASTIRIHVQCTNSAEWINPFS